MVELIVDPSGNTLVPKHSIHDTNGLAAPAYSKHLEEIYGAYKLMSMTNDPTVPKLSLTTTTDLTTGSEMMGAQLDTDWMHYEAANDLTPHQFATALAIRLAVIPQHLRLHGSKCNCGFIYTTSDRQTIDHVLTCDMSTHVTHTTRHNMVRDAIIHTARQYGITTTKEPTCFTYDSGRKQRPDALFHLEPRSIAIDVSLVSTGPPDQAIRAAQDTKNNTHKEVLNKVNTIFYPFVMATLGTIGSSAEQFIRAIAKAVQPQLQQGFTKALHHSVTTAAARGRADAISAAATRLRW
jgi:hypothetical protein